MKRNVRGALYSVAALGTALCLAAALCRPAGAETGSAPVETDAESYVLMEQSTGTILAEKNGHEPLEPASVTKVMTMLLVVEALDRGEIHPEDTVTASEHAAEMGGSQIYLEQGEQMTVNDLLKAVAVGSANDGAVALAEYLCGSETAFVERMNQRAQELGMEDTHFVNCNGLPAEGHLTSADDIALMSRELLSHARILDYTTIWMDTVRDGAFGLSNTNKLVKTYNGITGLKTGYTDSALYCISATAERDGMGLIAAVMGASTSELRFSAARELLDWGFASYALTDVTPQTAIPPVTVTMGEEDTVTVAPAEESTALLLEKSEAGAVTTEVSLPDTAEAPVTQGDALGELIVSVNGAERTRIPLLAERSVSRLTCRQIIRRLLGGLTGA